MPGCKACHTQKSSTLTTLSFMISSNAKVEKHDFNNYNVIKWEMCE